MNIPIIRPSNPDHKLSNEQMIQKLVDTCNWLSVTLFGQRDKSGKLLRNEHKDKDGKVLSTNYAVGLLQKFEGAYDMQEGKEPVLLQPGMEQLWKELKAMVEALMFQENVRLAILSVMLKIKPADMADFFEKHEPEVNQWIFNYKSRMRQNSARMEKEVNQKAEELKKLGVIPNADSEVS